MTRPSGHAVEKGEIRYISMSQIGKFDPAEIGGCNRRWFFDKVLHYKEPESKAHAAGVKFHQEIEAYQKTGQMTLGATTLAGKHLIPMPCDPSDVEVELDGILTAAGIPVTGRIDRVNASGIYLDWEGNPQADPEGTIEVIDWKSTKSLQFAKSGASLINTIQMAGYAKWASLRYPEARHFRLSHVYFQKQGARIACKNSALFSLATVVRRWHLIETLVDEMKRIAKEADPLRVEPNFNSCTVYGGCPFKTHCPRPVASIFGGEINMGLADKLKMFQTPEVTPMATASPAPSAQSVINLPASLPAASPAITREDLKAKQLALLAEMKRLEEEEEAAANPPVTAPVVANNPPIGLVDAGTPTMTPAATTPAAGVGLSTTPAAGTPATFECVCGNGYTRELDLNTHRDHCNEVRKRAEKARALDAFGVVIDDGVSAVCGYCGDKLTPDNSSTLKDGSKKHIGCKKAPAAIPPPDAQVSRPPTSALPLPPEVKVSPAVEAAAAPFNAPVTPAQAPTAPPVSTPAPEAPRKRGRPRKEAAAQDLNPVALEVKEAAAGIWIDEGFALYVDVQAQGLPFTPLDTYISALCRGLEAQFGLADIRYAPQDSPLAFGKWKGALAAAVRKNPLVDGLYILTGVYESEIKQTVVEALQPLAALFVRGVRF